MIRVEIDKLGYHFIHLDTDRYTHNTHKRFLKEARMLAKQYDYPKVFCSVPDDKVRFMEYFGMRIIQRRITEDGVTNVMAMETRYAFNR